MYSVTPILSAYTNKQGLTAVVLQVICGKAKAYPSTGVKINSAQWKNFQVTGHPLKNRMNAKINKKRAEVEDKLLNVTKQLSAKELSALLKGEEINPVNFVDFAYSYIDEMRFKFSEGRIKHYRVIINKILELEPKTLLTDINTLWLQAFENGLHQQGLKTSTIRSNIAIIKAIVKAAKQRKIINAYDFDGYKNVKVVADEPEFLTEDELQKFFDMCRAIQKPSIKLAGYYFLLSCFAGYRLENAMKFNYNTYVNNNRLKIRTNKFHKIVSVPIYKELGEVIDFIKDKPMTMTEQTIRKYIKEIVSLAGIKKHVKFHTSRHTATSRFFRKGLTPKQVQEIIGDTEAVLKIYTHISSQELDEDVLIKLN